MFQEKQLPLWSIQQCLNVKIYTCYSCAHRQEWTALKSKNPGVQFIPSNDLGARSSLSMRLEVMWIARESPAQLYTVPVLCSSSGPKWKISFGSLSHILPPWGIFLLCLLTEMSAAKPSLAAWTQPMAPASPLAGPIPSDPLDTGENTRTCSGKHVGNPFP